MTHRAQGESAFQKLVRSIVDDDPSTVTKILQSDPQVVVEMNREAHLFESTIVHWFYVGDTALHLAAAGHRAELVDLLLAAGADPNASGNHRRSAPLHYAADGYVIDPDWNAEQQVKTIERLMDAGALINAADKNGATPLHRAVRTRCDLAVGCLLARGASPLSRNNSGSTPFHLAVQNTGRGGSGEEKAKEAQREIIKRFLKLGISPDIRDSKGKTVKESARSGWIKETLGE